MIRAAAIAFACILSIAALTARQPSVSDPALTVPPGFEVEQVAAPPLVDRPIVADFDEQGRLYVADSSGSNDKVDKQLADRPHRIVRLEDTNGDGRFDKSVVFADKMMFPEGTMWFDGSLYVAAPPSIWKLTDTNGDGVADQREEWFEGKTLTNCANDLHGPYLGPDGWIYWTKGAFAQQTYERPGKAPLVTKAAHVLRRRPGDSRIEIVMTGGMDNPVDVAFTPTGERIFTATFLEHPQQGRRDALVHAIYGGVYGKPHAVIDGHPRTGDLMPVMLQLGPAVPAGLTRYASRVFGAEYRDTFFAAMFNLHKVTRHTLEPSGATFTTRDVDFLTSSSRDFHPTDVLEDADGSLLVVDTGPWYKLCCPTSQIAKPDILGAIYRVRRRGAPRVSDPRGAKLAWDRLSPKEMVGLLDDPRPAVVNRALMQLGKAGERAVPALLDSFKSSTSADARRNSVWALTRIAADGARAAVRSALNDVDSSVRHAAIHSAGLWRDAAAAPLLVKAMGSGSAPLQRAAAEALGRLGDAKTVPDVVTAAATTTDRVAEHSLTYALIEIGDPAATTAAGLRATAPRARRASLIALDQMGNGALQPDGVISLLDSPDATLKETAWWIASRHPEWGGALAQVFGKRLANLSAATASSDELLQRLAPFLDAPAIQDLLATTLASARKESRVLALRAMAMSRAKELPARWVGPLVSVFSESDVDTVRRAVAVVRAPRAEKALAIELGAALASVARNAALPLDVRLDATAAVHAPTTIIDADLFAVVLEGLDPARPVSTRLSAAAIVERAKLDRDQLSKLTAPLAAAGPLELPRLLNAFDHADDEATGRAMIAALRSSSARSSLRADLLRVRLAKYPESVRKEGEALLAVDAGTAGDARRLEALLASAQGGDIRRGQTVFNGQKAACATCHAIGYLGGTLGPDLTRIGQIRTERDLLEAIAFPSASFARGYEPVVVKTTAGEVHAGMLKGDLPEEIVLTTGDREEKRIARPLVADIQPGAVSLMPPGLAEQLTRQELADLLAFLKAARPQ